MTQALVIANRHLSDRYWQLTLRAPELVRVAQPGQFLMLTIARENDSGPVLPRPMAIFDWDRESGTLDVMYGVVGAGTTLLTGFGPGEHITTVGPLGRGFMLEPSTERALLVGRGIGTCSLTALAVLAARRGVDVVAVESARAAHALIGRSAYERAGVSSLYQVTDSDGSSDALRLRHALASDLVDLTPEQIFVCGSSRLLDLCIDLATEWGSDVQVSLEAHMACGLGYCHGCASGQRTDDAETPLICRDGPVLRWLSDDRAG